MVGMNRPRHWQLWRIALLTTLLFLAGCGSETAATQMLQTPMPTRPAIHRFTLSARQGLRDLTGDFSTRAVGADTAITLLPGEKVEIFATGAASFQADGQTLGPEGSPACPSTNLPEPALPCYAVIYSISATGQAAKVGSHADFVSTAEGNLFMGVNTPPDLARGGSFQITVLTLPPGTATGLWSSPNNGFTMQGTSVTLSAFIFSQKLTIASVQFTATVVGQPPAVLCNATALPAQPNYSCTWNFRFTNGYFHNGTVTFGFRILNSQGQATAENPDGLRSGIARYVATENAPYYAGYAAISPNLSGTYSRVSGRWTVPVAYCAFGEDSLVGVWAGITGIPDQSQLAQAGTVTGCQGGVPFYEAWWEMFPAPSRTLNEFVAPGDTITAVVTFQNNQFQLSMQDLQQGWTFSTVQPGSITDTNTAECIVEAPTLVQPTPHIAQLTDFGTISLSCQLTANHGIGDGPRDFEYQMHTPIADAVTSDLDNTGSAFTVQWRPKL
ncbi:MAG TPA: G1 family glutamic endopeptidase [Ktedonosporobacter sp.]|nr:G1 family glutamic endopeptidase [Ktedonosporobacter sp.]